MSACRDRTGRAEKGAVAPSPLLAAPLGGMSEHRDEIGAMVGLAGDCASIINVTQ